MFGIASTRSLWRWSGEFCSSAKVSGRIHSWLAAVEVGKYRLTLWSRRRRPWFGAVRTLYSCSICVVFLSYWCPFLAVYRSAVDSTHLVLLSLRRYVYLDLGLAIRNDLSLMVVERGCFIACGAVASQPFLARLLCSVLSCLVAGA